MVFDKNLKGKKLTEKLNLCGKYDQQIEHMNKYIIYEIV